MPLGPGLAGAAKEMVMSNVSKPDHGLVAHIYAAAVAQAISRQEGPSFEEILAQSIEAARVFAHEMAAQDSKQMNNWLGSLPSMK
jgi:hypothetical protein